MKCKCNSCGQFFEFEERLIIEEDPSPRGISLGPGTYSYAYCPHCGDDDFEEDFHLVDAIDIEEGENELSVIVSYRGRQIELILDSDGNLDGRHINSKGSSALIKRPALVKREEASA